MLVDLNAVGGVNPQAILYFSKSGVVGLYTRN